MLAKKGNGGEKSAGVPLILAERIREKVARGILPPGMRLGQAELALEFSTSRVPLREALMLLTSEGIVEHDPNRGFFIARFSTDEAQQLFLLRDMVEDALLKSVEWPDAETLKELEDKAAELEKILDSGDRTSWWTQHRLFHYKIFDLSPRKVLVREASRLWGLTDRYRAMLQMPRRGSPERAVVEKESFVEALKNKDRKQLIKVRRERRKAFEKLVFETLKERDL